MLNRITIETVHMLRSTVHSVNPDIHIGLMSSGGRYHTAEGRDWKALMQELDAGKSPAFHRPTLGSYSETAPFEFRYCLDSIQLSRYAAGNRPEFTEVENIPYSRFTKSACMTGAEILISAACGCAGAALNCYDHFGSPLELEPLYGKTFRKLRPNADALMKEAKNGKFRGLKMFHRDNAGKTAHLPENAGLSDLMESGFNAALFIPVYSSEYGSKIL
jgi:hypothetical protein